MMKKILFAMRLLLFTALVITLSETTFAGKLQQQLVDESTISKILKSGTLRVGNSTFAPWVMKDKTGKLIGFEIDVAKRLADDMGVAVRFVSTAWDGIIPALLSGKFDVIIGGMSVTAKRNQSVNFSIPYNYSGMSMVANRKIAAGFRGLEDFNRPDVAIAVRLGATPEVAAQKHVPKAQLRRFDSETKVFQELLNGRVHAAVSSAPTPLEYALRYPGKLFMPIGETFTKEPNAFALKKGDFDTLNYFNNWIRIVDAEGWLKERQHYWFGTRDWEKLLK
ncbi:transporter substrate-binding domain-containing protein [Thermodesulfobacteriota bacterium]